MNATLYRNVCPPLLHPDVCLLNRNSGQCRKYTIKWFYDSKQSRCFRFRYGGCGGNRNRFSTQRECEATCTTAPPRGRVG
uniref:BPTI/Kunitz inhibitor domain-containing protein n=1 Tax=Nothobranchius furzeri TaxID=105023 RepID=A0A8C6LNP8_NOTFU